MFKLFWNSVGLVAPFIFLKFQFVLQILLQILRLIIFNFLVICAVGFTKGLWIFGMLFRRRKLSMIKWLLFFTVTLRLTRHYVFNSFHGWCLLICNYIFKSSDEKVVLTRLQKESENHRDHGGTAWTCVVLFVIFGWIVQFLLNVQFFVVCQRFSEPIVRHLVQNLLKNLILRFKLWSYIFIPPSIFRGESYWMEMLELILIKRAFKDVLGRFYWHDFYFLTKASRGSSALRCIFTFKIVALSII